MMIALLTAVLALSSCRQAVAVTYDPGNSCAKLVPGSSTEKYSCNQGGPLPCCSQYGWCGSTAAYCGTGCQATYGRCGTAPPTPVPAPTPKPTLKPTPAPQAVGTPPAPTPRPTLKPTPSPPTPAPVPATASAVPVSVAGLSTFNWCGANRKWLALSFDGGFSEPAMTDLLADLKRNNMVATFFLSPAQNGAPDAAFCTTLANTIAAGHSIQHHSWTHPDFITELTTATQRQTQIKNLENWLVNSCGVNIKMTQFRPPYGSMNRGITQQMNGLGYTAASWSVDSDDWMGGSLDTVFNTVVSRYNALPAGASAVILHHDFVYIQGGTKGIIDLYKQKFPDYTFVTTKQCFDACLASGDCQLPQDVWPGVFTYAGDYTYP